MNWHDLLGVGQGGRDEVPAFQDLWYLARDGVSGLRQPPAPDPGPGPGPGLRGPLGGRRRRRPAGRHACSCPPAASRILQSSGGTNFLAGGAAWWTFPSAGSGPRARRSGSSCPATAPCGRWWTGASSGGSGRAWCPAAGTASPWTSPCLKRDRLLHQAGAGGQVRPAADLVVNHTAAPAGASASPRRPAPSPLRRSPRSPLPRPEERAPSLKVTGSKGCDRHRTRRPPGQAVGQWAFGRRRDARTILE